MGHTQSSFQAASGGTIFYQQWLVQDAKALLLLAHGLAEHSGRYDEFAAYCNERGYSVAAMDHPGHGRSDGTPGFVDRFDDYLDAFDSFRQRIAAEHPGLPLVLVGHSMGGLIAASYLHREQNAFCACVLSGPAVRSDVAPPAWQVALLRFISRVFPRLGVMKLDAAGVSRDPAVVEDYLNDPLVYTGKISARQAVEMFGAMAALERKAAAISLPILILHGADDALTSPEGSRLLCKWVSSSDKELKIYPSLYHEIFNEPEREQVMQDMLSWCESRIS